MPSYLGQNFLKDTKIKQFIADQILKIYKEKNCENLIEIGPGKGALTKKIWQFSKSFFVIEKDTKLVEGLQQGIGELKLNSSQIINSDILSVDEREFCIEKKLQPSKTMVVGNLPYYITSPILRKFFAKGMQEFAAGVFLIQYEVAEKIESIAKKKSYLRWLLNYNYQVDLRKIVPAKAFNPAPKVQSAVISLTPKESTPNIDFPKLQFFLDEYSAFSRKTLGKIQKMNEKKSQSHFQIPTDLKSKRLEELDRGGLERIFSTP